MPDDRIRQHPLASRIPQTSAGPRARGDRRSLSDIRAVFEGLGQRTLHRAGPLSGEGHVDEDARTPENLNSVARPGHSLRIPEGDDDDGYEPGSFFRGALFGVLGGLVVYGIAAVFVWHLVRS
jgi:hypothetical protein